MNLSLFNGQWKLDKSKNVNLGPLLKAMGRNAFEISCVSSADEDFVLSFSNNIFTKKVSIFLNDSILGLFAMFKPSITRIEYLNNFTCDGKLTLHPVDQKQFGKCDTICYVTKEGHIIIRWHLKDMKRIMVSDHSITPEGHLLVVITISHKNDSAIEVTSSKTYKRCA
jgi:hypothetical protein